MNDPTEVLFGFNVYVDELSSALDAVADKVQRRRVASLLIDAFSVFNQHHDDRFSHQLLMKCGFPDDTAQIQLLVRKYGDPDAERYRAVYLTSFSAKADDLTQWRTYADDAMGVCIGLHRNDLQGLQLHKPNGGRAKLQLEKVRYGRATARKYFQRQIRYALADSARIWHIAERCYKRIVTTKHECYNSEDEWRLFIYAKALKTSPEVDVAGRLPRPYIELPCFKDNRNLPVAELWTGPTSPFQADRDEGWKGFVAKSITEVTSQPIRYHSSSLPYRQV